MIGARHFPADGQQSHPLVCGVTERQNVFPPDWLPKEMTFNLRSEGRLLKWGKWDKLGEERSEIRLGREE